MERFYTEAINNFRNDNDYYEGNFEALVTLPEGFDLTVPATLRAVVDEAIDAVMPDDLIIDYQPRGLTKLAEEDADLIRRACRSLWHFWRRKASDIDPFRDAGKNLFRSGFCCIKLVPDYTLWPVLTPAEEARLSAEDEAKGTKQLKDRVRTIASIRERYVPLTPRSLSPISVLPDPTVGARKLWIIERYEAVTDEVKDLYAAFEKDFRIIANDYARHRVHEIWTADHADWKGVFHKGQHFVLVDEKLVNEGDTDSPYPDIPYIIKYSGYGSESYEGRPELKSVGFYTKQVKSLGKAEARRFSQFDAIMAQLAYPIAILPMEVDPDNFDTSPGAMNFVPDTVLQNADKLWLRAPIPDGEYLNSLKVISGQIERGTIQAAVRGGGVAGSSSAAQLDQTTGQAMLRLDSVKHAMEDVTSEVMAMALFYIDQILKGKMGVFGPEAGVPKYILGPSNIKGHYNVSVTFQPNEEQVKMRKLAIASDAIVKGGFSPYDALEYAGFDNPGELIARKLAYDLMQEPLVKRGLAREMLKEWGIDADAVEMEEQMDQGKMQIMLSQFMNAIQSGSMRGVGNPMTQNGTEPGGNTPGSPPMPGAPPPPPGPPPGNQNPLAALAQQGQGPMPMPVGAPPQMSGLQPPQMMQQPPMGAPPLGQ